MRNQLAFSQTLILGFWSASILAGASGATKTPGPADLGWPRQYTDGSAKLMLQQPQVDAWPDFKKLTARFAAALTIAKGRSPFGAYCRSNPKLPWNWRRERSPSATSE
jgi:hypothetical protein